MTKRTGAAERGRETAPPAPKLYDTAVNPTLAIYRTATTQGLGTMINNTKDFLAFGKANYEAITASGKTWVAGVQDLTKQVTGSAMATYDESVALAKALSAAKSVKEAIGLQNTHVAASIARALAESKSLADASIKLTGQAIAPLTARLDTAVGSLKKAA
jgi:phasin family protein